jgi:Cd2+/Zn2+-exporting ATPase
MTTSIANNDDIGNNAQTYHIGNMDCANCARELQEGVARLDGIRMVRVDFNTNTMTLEGDVPYDVLKQRVEALGKVIEGEAMGDSDDITTRLAQELEQRGGLLGFGDYMLARSETRLALLGGLLIAIGVVVSQILLGHIVGLEGGIHDHTRPTDAGHLIVQGIYTLAMAIALQPIAISGWNNLRINRNFNINLLMSIAAVGAVLIGEYLEAATVIFLFAIAEAIEGYTTDRARDSLRQLMALKPDTADVLDDAGNITNMRVEDVAIGAKVRVLAGERIPMDGVIMDGASGIDQAPITGESIPVHKAKGDDVFAGTINGTATLTIEVTRHASENTLTRIIRMVAEAQSQRANSQRLIDKFATVYTPAVVVLALIVAIVPPLFFNAPFYDTPDTQGWLYRALTMLVIACPCALVISTPVTVISAITSSARRGVLIKGGLHLETLGQVKAVVLDKTGTLTQGKPIVQSIVALKGSEDDLLVLASAIEHHSTHPLAQAIVHTAQERDIPHRHAQDVETLAGRGVQGVVEGQTVVIASHRHFDEHVAHDADLCQQISTLEAQGQTVMLIAVEGDVRGYIGVADALRPESQATLTALHQANVHSVMCTGDNPIVAKAIGAQVGIDDIRANLMPDDKVRAVTEVRDSYGVVAMVGDGINDTPALAAANVGVAMGGAGTAQAMETADIVLMADGIKQLPAAIRTARFARRLIMQNVGLSLVMKAGFLALAAMGGASLWVAVFADMGMSLIVTANGMRALKPRG